MRYRDFAADQPPAHKHRCNIATLNVMDHEWSELKKIRQANGPTRIAAVRSLAPRFQGFSVEIECSDGDAAVDLLVAWCKPAALRQCSPRIGTSDARCNPKP